MYDLVYDPGERCNLAELKEYEEIRNELAGRLEKIQERTNDPLLKGKIQIQPEWKVNRRECDKASSKNPEDYESLGK